MKKIYKLLLQADECSPRPPRPTGQPGCCTLCGTVYRELGEITMDDLDALGND